MKGCLTLPFRLASLALMVLLAYLAWDHRDTLRRWVHRMTAEPPSGSVEADESPTVLRSRLRARLDSLEGQRADSVILTAGEVESLMRDAIPAAGRRAIDSLRVRLGDGGVRVGATLDGSQLPAGSLGSLTEWVTGRVPVEAEGPLGLRRLGMGEWRLEGVKVKGVPLPRALWSRLAATVAPVEDGSFVFDAPAWITGIRVTPGGAILYGRRAER